MTYHLEEAAKRLARATEVFKELRAAKAKLMLSSVDVDSDISLASSHLEAAAVLLERALYQQERLNHLGTGR